MWSAMTETSRKVPTSERVKAFSGMVEDSNPSSDTTQALVAHVKEEEQEQRKVKEEQERWRRWWQQSLCAEFET